MNETEELLKKMGTIGKTSRVVDSDETTMRFTCDMCGKCCRDIDIMLTPYDVLKIRRHLGLQPPDFFNKYVEMHIGPQSKMPIVCLITRPQCVFIVDGKCSIHDARPTNCRGYPCGRIQELNKDTNEVTLKWILHQSCSRIPFRQQKLWKIKGWMAKEGLHEYWENGKPYYDWVEKWAMDLVKRVEALGRIQESATMSLMAWYGYSLDSIKGKDDKEAFKQIADIADKMIDHYVSTIEKEGLEKKEER